MCRMLRTCIGIWWRGLSVGELTEVIVCLFRSETILLSEMTRVTLHASRCQIRCRGEELGIRYSYALAGLVEAP